MAEIQVENLHKSFGDFIAVKGSTFTVRDGEFFCLLGPSGCGKTTTLRMIAGLELPTSGRILLGGLDVSFLRAAQRDIAFVFQLFALYPHMSVRQNIGFPAEEPGHGPRRDTRSHCRGCTDFAHHASARSVRCPVYPPAIDSASPSDGPLCDSPRPSSWTNH